MEFEFRDRATFLPDRSALVCADLHVGKDASSNVTFELGEREDLVGRLEALSIRYDPDVVVIAGDLLHSFERVPAGAASTVRAIADAIDAVTVVVPGNHDTMLTELWDGPITPEYRLGDVVVTHGHVEPAADADHYVVGHDHPTIEIEGVRHPCYLYGPDQYRGADVLMVPSFSRLPAGVVVNDLSTEEFLSPLVTDADRLRPIVRDERSGTTHEFPPLGEFRSLL